MRQEYLFHVNGLKIRASYREEEVTQIFLPLLKRWKRIQSHLGRRIVVFVSAPPGAGKTTVCQFLEYLAHKEGICSLQSVGLDGFHYHQDYILNHTVTKAGHEIPMKLVKGCPETYDTVWMEKKLRQLGKGSCRFPVYSRILHDVVEEATEIKSDIILVEGNWLLLSEEPWLSLMKYCDDSVFIYADECILRDRLIDRKVKGGLSPEEARRYYERSDKENVQRLLANHVQGRVNMRITQNGDYEIC